MKSVFHCSGGISDPACAWVALAAVFAPSRFTGTCHNVKDLLGRAQVKGRLVLVLGILDKVVVATTGNVGFCCQTLCRHKRAQSSQVSIEDDRVRSILQCVSDFLGVT